MLRFLLQQERFGRYVAGRVVGRRGEVDEDVGIYGSKFDLWHGEVCLVVNIGVEAVDLGNGGQVFADFAEGGKGFGGVLGGVIGNDFIGAHVLYGVVGKTDAGFAFEADGFVEAVGEGARHWDAGFVFAGEVDGEAFAVGELQGGAWRVAAANASENAVDGGALNNGGGGGYFGVRCEFNGEVGFCRDAQGGQQVAAAKTAHEAGEGFVGFGVEDAFACGEGLLNLAQEVKRIAVGKFADKDEGAFADVGKARALGGAWGFAACLGCEKMVEVFQNGADVVEGKAVDFFFGAGEGESEFFHGLRSPMGVGVVNLIVHAGRRGVNMVRKAIDKTLRLLYSGVEPPCLFAGTARRPQNRLLCPRFVRGRFFVETWAAVGKVSEWDSAVCCVS